MIEKMIIQNGDEVEDVSDKIMNTVPERNEDEIQGDLEDENAANLMTESFGDSSAEEEFEGFPEEEISETDVGDGGKVSDNIGTEGKDEKESDDARESMGSDGDGLSDARRRRCSSRNRQRRQIFTYNEMGGNPVYK